MANQQRGIALISVLLVFALITIIASEMVHRNNLDIRKTAAAINSKQAYQYALAGEQYARQILYRDYEDSHNGNGSGADTLEDSWAQLKQGFQIDNGKMTISIVDLQSRFNLNNLLNSDGSIDAMAATQFRKLLTVLDIDRDYTGALSDWLDIDNQVTANGAEDSVYRKAGYLAANGPLYDRTELRLLNGFKLEDYIILKDYVVALPKRSPDIQSDRDNSKPKNEKTAYNLNTLSGKLAAALADNISSSDLDAISRIQQRGGRTSVAQWLAESAVRSLSNSKSSLTTESEYFEVTVRVEYAQRLSSVQVQLFRNTRDGNIEVLKRQQLIE